MCFVVVVTKLFGTSVPLLDAHATAFVATVFPFRTFHLVANDDGSRAVVLLSSLVFVIAVSHSTAQQVHKATEPSPIKDSTLDTYRQDDEQCTHR